MRALVSAAAALSLLSGCTTVGKNGRDTIPETTSLAFIPHKTQTQRMLEAIPPPQRPVAIAVYDFTDQTGQFKPMETTQTLSRAVTQGASSILVKALQDAGDRQWFTIVERESLKNLLSERQIIREMRERYLGEKDVNAQALPALLFAGVLLEGGIISYDTNTVSGGAGAAFLGIGGHTDYRQDTVTVYLRAVSVRTGEVLTTVTASKTIASKAISANAFKFVAFKELLEAEAGITTNEPDHLALQQAIEKAVFDLVMEGVELKLWNFADAKAGWPLVYRYDQERNGTYSAAQVQQAMERSGELAPTFKPNPAQYSPMSSKDSKKGATTRSGGR
jgi:curli production assembly/transport component CsgG